ncbi:hypothetical protein OEZ85_014302 [Tetradesmus obliquus]|uniref:CNH domain-containing protein n=1 Tax=Tetradesmus obliquus TaxID=3088 RepID=A0ABY8U869_TETOB|nr:hypothetical protein OEZ85_014302 [Tetradesmus obliquus]
MAFEAYEPSVVVDEFARKIDSLCVWEDNLIAGLSDGSLLFFQEQQQGSEQGSSRGLSSWQVTRVQKNFGKRGVQQLQALENKPYLLSLSDDGVQLHRLPELQLVSAASRTARGAAAFAWDEGRQLLATAVKKKVISHQLDIGHTFLEMTEYELPEAPCCITWVGPNILLGTPKSYWLIVPAASQAVEVLPGTVVMMYPAVQPQLLFAAGSHAPVLTRLAPGEALVTKDAISYFLGPDGKPLRKTTLSWSAPPNALAAGRQYVAALLPGCVEVKSISRAGAAAAAQTLLLPGMTVAAPTPSSAGCLYIASSTDKGIRQLLPVPLERQARLLAAAGDFQGALELLSLMEDEEAAAAAAAAAAGSEAEGDAAGGGNAAAAAAAAKRQQLEDVLRLRFGFHLFEDGEAVLTAAGRYAELAALYQYNRRHAQGLALLQQLSQRPEGMLVPPSGAAADLKGLPGVWAAVSGAAADLKGLPGVWAAVRYLIGMQPQDLQLLVQHAGWVLGADPEAGLEALLAMNPPLKPDLVMPVMQEHAPTYTAVYLESALDLGLVSPSEVHSELLLIYLHMALEEEREGEQSSAAHARQLSLSDLLVSRPRQLLKLFPDDKAQWGAPTPRASQSGGAAAAAAAAASFAASPEKQQESTAQQDCAAAADDAAGKEAPGRPAAAAAAAAGSSALADPNHPQHRSDAYQRLRELVYASEHIDPEYVLAKLGQGQLLEIRALMLERLGRHREALSLYAHDLAAMPLAEAYCDRVYEAGLAATAAAAGGGGGSATAAAAAADGSSEGAEDEAEGPSWGRVLPGKLQQQQQARQQQQQRRGRRALGQGGGRGWAAMPFGSRPHDIYMELVDAVLQGPTKQQGNSAAAGAAAGQQQQQQQVVVDQSAWQQLAQLLSKKVDRINHLQVLQVLPQQLPLSDVAPLLSSMLLHNTEQKRNLSVVHALRRAENLMAREDLVKVKQRLVR